MNKPIIAHLSAPKTVKAEIKPAETRTVKLTLTTSQDSQRMDYTSTDFATLLKLQTGI